jgi:RNA polymerase sigma factor (TIGR02999 family)
MYNKGMNEVTRILAAIDQGDVHAAEKLLPLVYQELRQLAAQKMSQEVPGQTLQATALVHEAYIRLVGAQDQNWRDRGHFYAAAAEAMRRILVDNARRKKSLKHGGNLHRIHLNTADLGVEGPSYELIALDEAIDNLSRKDKVKADLVKLRYFSGLTNDQAAKILGISPSTADRYWAYARSWLRLEISKGDETDQS